MSTQRSENVATFSGVFLNDKSHFHDTDMSCPDEWLKALRTDNVQMARTILQSASTAYKEFLMNGDIPTFRGSSIDHVPQEPHAISTDMEFCITKPLHAAAIFHSHVVLKLLWESGADILQVDRWQNNVVHMLIYADYKGNIRGTKNIKTLSYLQELFPEKDLKSLMIAENAFLLRPLEFATLYGCINMAGVIMQTKGVYLIKEEHRGYSVQQYFDISDYELFDHGIPPRFYKSPLAFLNYIGTSRIDLSDSDSIFDDPGLKSWVHAKIMVNWPFVLIWCLFRICYIGLFFSASMRNSWPTIVSNAADHHVSNGADLITCSSQMFDLSRYQWYILVSTSIVILIYDLFKYLFMRKLFHPTVNKLITCRHFIAHVQFYHWIQIITCSSMVGIFTCQTLRSMGFAVPLTLDNLFFGSVSFGCMWGIVYFLQVLPWISIYAIAVQKMLHDFVRFALIFVIFLCACAIWFRRVLLGNSNGCPKNFDTVGETIYSTFLVMINLINFREYENADKTSLYILHIVFVFFISILLINFLIATMTQSFSDVHAKRRATIQMQRLSLMMTVQLRLAWPLQALYKKLQKRAFVYHNKRMCLRRTLIKGENFEPTFSIQARDAIWYLECLLGW